jgi:hypothetical protein
MRTLVPLKTVKGMTVDVAAAERVAEDAAERGQLHPGVIHSPAIGFFMDVTAAIRAVYRGDDPGVGRKPTLYLDRHGQRVALPRDIQAEQPETAERKPR